MTDTHRNNSKEPPLSMRRVLAQRRFALRAAVSDSHRELRRKKKLTVTVTVLFPCFLKHSLICKMLVDQGYNLEKIYFWKFYGRYNDLLQHRNTPCSHIFVWSSPLLMCITYMYTGFDLTGHDWLYSWFHGGYVATAGEVYSSCALFHTLGFSRLSVLSWLWHLFPTLLCLWTPIPK